MSSQYDDYVESQNLDELYDHTADNVYAWLCCPCERHMFFVGVTAGTVLGYSCRLVIQTAMQILRDDLADEERELPDGVDVLRLADLERTLWPDG